MHEGDKVFIKATIAKSEYPDGNMIPIVTENSDTRIWVSPDEVVETDEKCSKEN